MSKRTKDRISCTAVIRLSLFVKKDVGERARALQWVVLYPKEFEGVRIHLASSIPLRQEQGGS
jgi:hypothetical protein